MQESQDHKRARLSADKTSEGLFEASSEDMFREDPAGLRSMVRIYRNEGLIN